MKNRIPHYALFLFVCGLYLGLTPTHADEQQTVKHSLQVKIKKINEKWQQALVEGDIPTLISIYDKNSIFMPEYQPTLNGLEKIQSYYEILNQKRRVKQVLLNSQEIIVLDNYVLEIGTFEKQITWLNNQADKTQDYSGKYWRLWHQLADMALVGEAFGFFEPISQAQLWVTDLSNRHDPSPSGFQPSDASIELMAYHAIGQKGVKQKNGELRAQLYAADAIFYPFADKPKKGIEILKPYLIKYSSHDAIIDSVQTHTHDVIYLDNYIVEFTKFAVAWSYNQIPGRADGKGIVLRKRMENGELRNFRHIGMHNFEH